MWAELGLDLERHDEFLEGLGPAYQEIYLNQGIRPKGMEYFDFITSEVHGLRIKELPELKEKGCCGDILCVYVPEEIVMAAPLPFLFGSFTILLKAVKRWWSAKRAVWVQDISPI